MKKKEKERKRERVRFLLLADTLDPRKYRTFFKKNHRLLSRLFRLIERLKSLGILTADGCRSMRSRLRKNILGHFVQPRLTHISILAAVGLTYVCACVHVCVYVYVCE